MIDYEEDSPLGEDIICKKENTGFSSLKKEQWRDIEQPIDPIRQQDVCSNNDTVRIRRYIKSTC